MREIGIVVLCRLHSTRLPNKALLPLGDLNVIQQCLIGCSLSAVDPVVLCTSIEQIDDPLSTVIGGMSDAMYTPGFHFFRGSENPAWRCMQAATEFHWDHIVRVTGDSPLISHHVIDQMVESHLLTNADFSYSDDPPLGSRCEIIKVSALEYLIKHFDVSKFGEYLSLFFKNNTTLFEINRVELPEYKFEARLNVDYPEDYDVVKQIVSHLDHKSFDLLAIKNYLETNPNVLKLNSHIVPIYKGELKREIEQFTSIPKKTIKVDAPIDFFLPDFSPHTILDDNSAQILICNPGSEFMYDEGYLVNFKNLEVLATPSTGVTHIDLDYCKNRGIPVLTLLLDRQSLSKITASAEFSWLLVLDAMRHFYRSVDLAKHGHWRDVEDDLRGQELCGKNIGIIGLGRIGSKISKFAKAFGMNVMYYDPYVHDPTISRAKDLRQIAKFADIINIHPYLTAETRGMIDASFLSNCKQGAVIVNTSRGEVVVESDICDAVESGQIFYSTDVVMNEQNITEFHSSRLFSLFEEGKVTITPHIAGATLESQEKAMKYLVRILNKFIVEGSKC